MLDRRGFLLTGLTAGAGALWPACMPAAGRNEPAEGTFDRPYTEIDPGPWIEKIAIHQPVLYASTADGSRVRLWAEVRDTGKDLDHEMSVEHYIERILIVDEFYNTIADRSFLYGSESRLVATVDIPEGVEQVHAFALCNLHGWWQRTYNVSDLRVSPLGDARRAYTATQPGVFADQVPSHVPILGRRPDGRLSVEVGDRAQNKLHPQDANHYIELVTIYDQNDQLRLSAPLGPNAREAIFNFDFLSGTEKVRVLAQCNSYGWWEAEYTLS